MAGEMDIKVAFVVNLPGDLTAVTVQEPAELYDEMDPKRRETTQRCVSLGKLRDPLGGMTEGSQNLRSWVTHYVDKVLIYADKPDEVKLGGPKVGLTGVFGGDWTKPVDALVMDSLAPLTLEDLRKAGKI